MSNANRQLRARHASLADAVDRLPRRPPASPGRRLVQIYSSGSLPTSVDTFYLSHPIEIDGSDHEGSPGAPLADTSQTIPVVVLDHSPSAGDILPAFAIGGRWVAERGGQGGASLICSPCSIPQSDLTISWINPLTGNGSDTMVYSSVGPAWSTGCSGGSGLGNPFLFRLYCTSGSIELRVYFFISGSCPTGESAYCSNLQSQGSQLILSDYTCDPGLTLTFDVMPLSCPTVSNSGFTRFTITR